jgi:hypothetical protein
MQREVLNRSVNCGGDVFDAGTPIENVPSDNRESCQRSGWTRFEVVRGDESNTGDSTTDNTNGTDESNQTDQSHQTDLANQTTDQSQTAEQNDQSNLTDQTELANQNQNVGGDEPLSETDLEIRVIEILANATPAITTKAQAREFLAANKTFRIIEGIGKASDAAIRSVIGEAAE